MKLIPILFFSLSAFADTYVIKSESAAVYGSPSAETKQIGKLPKGKKINSSKEENGFYQITTRSGRKMWVKNSDVEVRDEIASDIAEEDGVGKHGNSIGLHLTWDLGVSGGSYQGHSYTEGELGVNLFF